MSLKFFICPDNEQIETVKCLQIGGCRLKDRCAPLAYLQSIAYDRDWRGITASMAGNGPRLIYLQRVTDYAIKPDDRTFAVLGIKSHAWLGRDAVTNNVFSEEKTEHGRPDCLELDEYGDKHAYILYDYKTYGSYKVAKVQGLVKQKDKTFTMDPSSVDIRDIQLQMNRYRMDWEVLKYPISHMYIFCIVRDGSTYIAKSRGIMTNTAKIEIPKLANKTVEIYYSNLENAVDLAMKTGKCRRCDDWESWDGKRCESFCPVKIECIKMDRGTP